METLVTVTGIFRDRVSAEFYEGMLKICPSESERVYTCVLPEGDLRLQALLAYLQDQGWQPGSRYRVRAPNEFSIRMRRVYDRADRETAAFLKPVPKALFAEVANPRESGELEIQTEDLRNTRADISFAWYPTWMIVSGRLKGIMEGASLRHAVFRPVVFTGEGRERYEGRFWELTSDLILPPLSPACDLRTRDGEPFDGDYDKGCFLNEGFHMYQELHYTGSGLVAVEPFDLALTREQFGNRANVVLPEVVASKRFYEFCVEQKLKMDWIPVRVDPD